MKTIGWIKTTKKNIHYYRTYTNKVFVFTLLCAFAIFSIYEKLSSFIFSDDKSQLLTQELADIAFYFNYYDKELSQNILVVDEIIKAYQKNENVLISRDDEIRRILSYLSDNIEYITDIGFGSYTSFLKFVIDITDNKEDLYDMLGKYQERHYLVILQNTSEKRPNGGFFGSFALVSLYQGVITQLEIIDAYYPNRISPNSSVQAPERATFLPSSDIRFIAANKFGFTDIDGKNIQQLYEQSFTTATIPESRKEEIFNQVSPEVFDKKIHGVLFLRSDLFTETIPGFDKRMRERQFTNASIDLIRGSNEPNKKEIYINQVNNYFSENKYLITKKIIENFEKIIKNNYLQFYTEFSPSGIHNTLEKYNLTNNPNQSSIYSRDTNASFNKVDHFVEKIIQVIDNEGNIHISQDHDIIDISGLKDGTYTMQILYSLQIPQFYKEHILGLEQQYEITMTDRERGIMALQPARDYITAEERRWATKSLIHFPIGTTIHTTQGDSTNTSFITTPFSQGVYYEMLNNNNNTTQGLNITFTLPKKQ